ncbi:MAG TPA: hypothetical protein VJ909_01540 [Prolixibacteraceae bacterium]|nr:hypothetical protein [Prolixibacteraceae bacterium]
MKKILLYLFVSLATSAFMFSCIEIEEDSFDESLLVGKWESGTLFYNYNYDGTGSTWDEGDDVTEEEAQEFTWTLVEDELTHIHIMEIGGTVPKIYTVTKLTETTLEYEDGFGVKSSFAKVTVSP